MNTFSARFPPLLYGKPRGEALQIVQSFFHFFQSRRGIWRPVPGCCIFAAFFMTMTRKTRRPARRAVRGGGFSVRIAKGKRQVLPCAGRRSVFGAEKSKSATRNVLRVWLAERVGFEPTEHCCSTVFKTASLNHSDTSPKVHRSSECFISIAWNAGYVKHYFLIF